MSARRLAVPARLAVAVVLSLVLAFGLAGSAHAATGVRDACGTAHAGQARCDAQIVVSGARAEPVHPKVRSTMTRTDSRVRSHASLTSALGEPAEGTPLYLQQAYDLTALSATQGVNATVAVVDAYSDPSVAADLSIFRADTGLPACTTTSGCFRVLNQTGATTPLPAANSSWSVEESLDVDAVSALCPNCKIVLVEANGPDGADMQHAIQAAVAAGATIVSNSWSVQATTTPFSSNLVYPGVSILAASGDNGTASAGQSAYPAALPTVTAVGGTTLSPSAAGPRGFVESAWDQTGSGCDTYESVPVWQPHTGCTGRAYSDVSADGDPTTGLDVYDSQAGGWLQVGGSSLAAPLVAAFEAITGVKGTTPQWAYTDEPLLNGVDSGSNGACLITVICNATIGWSGPGGAGSISGDVVQGEPGIGGPDANGGTTYTESASSTGAELQGGIYPNGEATSYYWQYGTSAAYGSQTAAATIPAGTSPVSVTGVLAALAPATTYYYRLVASNASGTSYGYGFTLTTTAAGQVISPVTTVAAAPVQHKPVNAKPAKRKPVKHKAVEHRHARKHKRPERSL